MRVWEEMETKKTSVGQWWSTYHDNNNNKADTQAPPPETQLVILINETQMIPMCN